MWEDKIKTGQALPYYSDQINKYGFLPQARDTFGWGKFDTFPNRIYKNTKPPKVEAMIVLDQVSDKDFFNAYFDQKNRFVNTQQVKF